jgi:hypothetical protein
MRHNGHFFALNSDWREVDGSSAGSAQAAWLQERITQFFNNFITADFLAHLHILYLFAICFLTGQISH